MAELKSRAYRVLVDAEGWLLDLYHADDYVDTVVSKYPFKGKRVRIIIEELVDEGSPSPLELNEPA